MKNKLYSTTYQITRDIDWFARCNGKLYHFASNGGHIPDCITSKRNGEMLRFLLHLSEQGVNNDCDVENIETERLWPYLTIQTGMQEFSQEAIADYRKSFQFFASLGCVSMDRLSDDFFEDNRYFAVAWPGKNKIQDKVSHDLQVEYQQLLESLPELTDEIVIVD